MLERRALIYSPIVAGLLSRFSRSDLSLGCAVGKRARMFPPAYVVGG